MLVEGGLVSEEPLESVEGGLVSEDPLELVEGGLVSEELLELLDWIGGPDYVVLPVEEGGTVVLLVDSELFGWLDGTLGAEG